MDNVVIGQFAMGIYGVLLIAGGMMGYVKLRSRVSLFAGAITGGMCVGATWLSLEQPSDGFTIGSLVAFLLSGVFINRFVKTRKLMPAGIVLVLSLIVGILLMILQQDLIKIPAE